MKIKGIKTICGSCDGTGLYEGMCEKKGHPVVCLDCEGSGCLVLEYKPFIKRKLRRGVKSVSLSQGRFILTGVGKTGDSVSYKDFLKGKIKYNRS